MRVARNLYLKANIAIFRFFDTISFYSSQFYEAFIQYFPYTQVTLESVNRIKELL